MRAGLHGQSGPSVLSPVALGPSREAGLVMSPATPAWAPPFRQGHAVWANVIREVSVPGRVDGSPCGYANGRGWCLEAVASGKALLGEAFS